MLDLFGDFSSAEPSCSATRESVEREGSCVYEIRIESCSKKPSRTRKLEGSVWGDKHSLSPKALGGNETGWRIEDTSRKYERQVNKEEYAEGKTRKREKTISEY